MTTRSTGLLSLPDELLSAIVRDAAASKELPGRRRYVATIPTWELKALSLVCRRVGRLAQLELHSNVEVGGTTGLSHLANTLHHRTDLRAAVQSLSLEYRDNSISKDPFERVSEYDDDRSAIVLPSSAELSTFESISRDLLSSPFPALKELLLSALPCTLFVKVLAQVGKGGTVPNLRRLDLQSDFESARPTVWKTIGAFPNLTEIAFNCQSTPVLTPEECLGFFPAIRSVRLRMDAYEPAALESDTSPFNCLFPNLKALRLDGLWDRDGLERLLATTSSTLTELWVPTATDSVDLSSILRLFPRLEVLRFSGHIASNDIIPLLAASCVEYLGLTGNTGFDADMLCDLMLHPSRSSLTTIQLDEIPGWLEVYEASGILNYSLRDVGPADIVREVERLRRKSGPRWTWAFEPDGLCRLLSCANARGVRVTGGTIALLDWEDKFDEQLERQLVKRATEKDDYSVLLAYYGLDVAKDAIRRHRPAQAQLWSSSA